MEDVQAAEHCHPVLDHVLHGRGIGDICGEVTGFATSLAQRMRYPLRIARIDVHHQNPRTLRTETLCGGLTDTGATPGDQCHLAR